MSATLPRGMAGSVRQASAEAAEVRLTRQRFPRSGTESMSDADLVRALAHFRDEQFATLLCVALELAARTHAPELRQALASVFDLSAVDATTRRAWQDAKQALAAANEARELLRLVHEQIDAMEAKFDALNTDLEGLTNG